MISLPIARLLLALAFVITGGVAWTLAGAADALADVREHAATLQLDATSRVPTKASIGRLWTWLDPEAQRHAAVTRYWRREWDLDKRVDAEPDDIAAQTIAANATYRRLRSADAAPMNTDRLDEALQAYASVLRNGFDREAAYNYEFIVRQRDQAARARTSAKLPSRIARPSRPSTIHGREGTEPPTTKGEEFEVLTPMDYGDREAQPEPTTGRKLPRKG